MAAMCALRRVEDGRAGPEALGILVPPGRRTFLILRPRALPWDLLLLQSPEGSSFRTLGREEATAAARALCHGLETWSGEGAGRVEVVAAPDGKGSWLRARVGGMSLLACPRRPGQPYQPHVFADAAEARASADRLLAILCPPAGVEQELYVNTHHFGR